MTPESITAALHNLQAQINEVMGLMKDTAKQRAQEDTAANIVKYSIRLAQLEGAFITLQQHAPTLVLVAQQYPMPPVPTPEKTTKAEPEGGSITITEGVSETFDRVAKIHADTAAHHAKEVEE